jgi:cytochrome o ubiquinol oxidase subunit IV
MKHHAHHSAVHSYVIGFLLSLILTFLAYLLVVNNLLENTWLITTLLILAFAQLFVQLYFFLHLGQEKKPRWNLIFFVSTAGIILLIMLGSLWIMHHLNYNMMPEHVEEYIMQDESIETPNGIIR